MYLRRNCNVAFVCTTYERRIGPATYVLRIFKYELRIAEYELRMLTYVRRTRDVHFVS